MKKLKRGEKIKDVEGFEGLYQITTLGRVWSIHRKIWMKQSLNNCGYPYVSLSMNNKNHAYTVHRLVGKVFLPNPDNKPQINHLNGIKGDNRLSNLEWCTARENIQHACNTGLNKVFKIHTDVKHIICRAYKTGDFTLKRLAEIFGISAPGIWYIVKTYTPIVYPV